MSFPVLGQALPKRGNRFSRGLGKGILALMGWTFKGTLPNLPKCVVIAAPHTSNWDFVLGIAVVLALGLDAHWIGKDTIFRPPLGILMRFLGGMPVDRRTRQGVVTQMIDAFERREQFVLGMAPEGTRKRVDRWRTGFYHMACGARVPIVLGYFDYAHKVVGIGHHMMPTGDLEADMSQIRAFYADIVPKKPDQF